MEYLGLKKQRLMGDVHASDMERGTEVILVAETPVPQSREAVAEADLSARRVSIAAVDGAEHRGSTGHGESAGVSVVIGFFAG